MAPERLQEINRAEKKTGPAKSFARVEQHHGLGDAVLISLIVMYSMFGSMYAISNTMRKCEADENCGARAKKEKPSADNSTRVDA